jgi:hypothetical protein
MEASTFKSIHNETVFSLSQHSVRVPLAPSACSTSQPTHHWIVHSSIFATIPANRSSVPSTLHKSATFFIVLIFLLIIYHF